jgi:signal peptidase II
MNATSRRPQGVRAIGYSVALAGILIDQAHKFWMLRPFDIAAKGRVALMPFLDLVLVWNRGISYGLLPQDGDIGRWLLVALGIGGAVLFSWWLLSTKALLPALALGLVIAGAISNVIDRLLYGAVADFFLFHVSSFEWYVFNLADVWIVAGAIGLILAWLTERPEIATEA